ncbi:MAG: phosphatase PAP2 family protein [Tidjanibacter sp.]|nr:phosphatase PAP2 family protein [Tidjanibacter sp.]
MKKLLIIIVALSCSLQLHSENNEEWGAKALERTVSAYGVSEHPSLTTSTIRPLTFWNNRTVQVGLGLVGSGIVLSAADMQTRALRMDYIPKFRYKYDDYLQFSPAVAMVAMKAMGVESRSSWERMILSDGLSMGVMLSTVYAVKYGLGRLRPDGSTHNSFPSGHTAMAFTSATMLHKEYGHLSPWVSIAGYSVATITGISRALNNRHWLSDIVVGAGVGILSTELGYLIADKILGNRGLRLPVEEWEPVRVGRNPSFVGIGIAHNALLYDRNEWARVTPSGIGFSIEGAWFWNPYIGVGATAKVGRYANLVERATLGADTTPDPEPLNNMSLLGGLYLNRTLDRAERLHLGAKALVGVGYNHHLATTITNPTTGAQVATIEYDTSEHLSASVGVSLRWIVADNLGVRAYADYNYIRTDWDFTPTSEDGTATPTRHSAYHRPLTFGIAVDAMLW